MGNNVRDRPGSPPPVEHTGEQRRHHDSGTEGEQPASFPLTPTRYFGWERFFVRRGEMNKRRERLDGSVGAIRFLVRLALNKVRAVGTFQQLDAQRGGWLFVL